jgi:5-methylcytosine-specific restriction endonuclease McrA
MIRKKKTCITCKTDQFIFSRGRCKSCASREDNKPIKKVYTKQIEKNKDKALKTKELHLFMYEWWKKQPVNKCMNCGCNLPKEFCTWMVDHLLEKSQYPQFSMTEDNYFLVCFEDHSAKTNGFPKMKHKEAIEKAKLMLLK